MAKCYISEPDAPRVRQLAQRADRLHSSVWCLAEMACILHRHFRERSLTRQQVARLLAALRADVDAGVWTLLPLSDALIGKLEAEVARLPAHLFLRAGDAVHLVTARDAGFPEIWTNDRRLLDAAAQFGLRGRTA